MLGKVLDKFPVIPANPIAWAIAGVVLVGGITLVIVKARNEWNRAKQPMTIVTVQGGEIRYKIVPEVRNGDVILCTQDGGYRVMQPGTAETTFDAISTTVQSLLFGTAQEQLQKQVLASGVLS